MPADTRATASRVAIVTGGTRGIGRAISERLLDDGWSVMATFHTDHDNAAAFAAGREMLAVRRMATSDAAECGAIVAEAVQRF